MAASCALCQKVKAKVCKRVKPGARPWVKRPFESIQVAFTELPRCGRKKYLLVLVDQLTGWPEAYPCSAPTAKQVVKVLINDIISRFGIPEVIHLDLGAHFGSRVTQEVARLLGIKWAKHCPWRPTSSGQIERMNRNLKQTLTKICAETKLKWPDAQSIALTHIRAAPQGKLGLSPFELLYGSDA